MTIGGDLGNGIPPVASPSVRIGHPHLPNR
jgi:hypothetical protein